MSNSRQCNCVPADVAECSGHSSPTSRAVLATSSPAQDLPGGHRGGTEVNLGSPGPLVIATEHI